MVIRTAKFLSDEFIYDELHFVTVLDTFEEKVYASPA
jgi:hypothetical protein